MPELREVFDMTTKQIEPDRDAWQQQERRQRNANRNKRIGAFAVAAAIGVAAIAVVLGTRGGQDTTTPAGQPTGSPVASTAEEVAAGFVEAIADFDTNRAISYLADDAAISELMASIGAQDVEGTLNEFRLFVSLLEAQGYDKRGGSCEEKGSSASGTRIRCAFYFHLLGSDAFGLAPFSGSSFDLTVLDGAIVRASMYWESEEFSPQVWEPFAAWVSSNHPEDAAVMYTDEDYSGVQLTEESVELWGRRIREYVNEAGSITGAPTVRLSRIVDGVPFSVRVPTNGWQPKGTISINKSTVGPQGAEAIIFWTSFPDGGDADPCPLVVDPPVGPTAADLAAAVSTAPGTELVAGPSDVTVGGRPAKHVVLTIREDLGCDPGYFYTWQAAFEGTFWTRTGVDDTIRVWIVEVGGTLLFIEAETTTQAGPDLEREIQQIVGSIRFG